MDFDAFDALTFDCYGTMIDWETGLLAALRAAGAGAPDDVLLEHFARHEAELEAGPYLRYADVLSTALRRMSGELGFAPTDEQISAFGRSVEDWPAFEDSREALKALKTRFKLGVITNCDDDLFAASNEKLGVEFDWIITAEQVRSYKPSERNFHAAFERIGLPRERILHVAQSLFHDHVPAKALGLTTVWIDRRHDRDGWGATPPADATPDLTLPDLKSLAALAVPQG
jgi:2-haloacid dehalogenase